MRRVMLTTLGVLALAGCQKTEEKAESAETAAAPAAASAPGALGMRKAGLWTQTVSSPAGDQTMKMCMGEEDLSKASIEGPKMDEERCSKQSVTPRPGGWSFESVCALDGGGTMTSHGTATGGGDGYTMDMTATTTGSPTPQANTTMNIKLQAKWEGPCPAGTNPGDLVEMTMGGMTIKGDALKAMRNMGKGGN